MTSTLGIKKIQYPNGTNSITIDSSGSAAITTANITTAAITTANVTNATATGTITTPSINGTQIGGRRNIVINGAMQIWQRATSFSVSDNIYTCDRWLTEFGGLGAFTLSRSTDTPDEFGYSLKLDCTTADASPAAGDVFQLFHRIEGQNLQQLKKGTASAEKVTLSFFVKSNKTGNMQVNLRDANSRIIGNTYTINSANTWERKTITFDGDTSGTIANDNTTELTIEFPISSGSTYTSGAVPTAWEASSNADRNAGSTINLADSTSNEWYLTGVQLEVGAQATAFEHRSFGEEIALCQRYYYQSKYGAAITSGDLSFGPAPSPIYHSFTTEMRVDPTVTTKTDVDTGSGRYVVVGVGNYTNGDYIQAIKNRFTMRAPTALSHTSNRCSCGLIADAEL